MNDTNPDQRAWVQIFLALMDHSHISANLNNLIPSLICIQLNWTETLNTFSRDNKCIRQYWCISYVTGFPFGLTLPKVQPYFNLNQDIVGWSNLVL